MRMTAEKAVAKALQVPGIVHVFGIVGPEPMPISGRFPVASIDASGIRTQDPA